MNLRIKRERSLPAIDRSMTGGGEGPSIVEVATSFPARLFGAIGELWKFLKFQTKKEEEEKSQSALKISKRSGAFSFSPIRLL